MNIYRYLMQTSKGMDKIRICAKTMSALSKKDT